jgi:hypothetical protein
LRKSPAIAVGVAATLALGGGIAVAQNPAGTHTLQMSVQPSKAGTPKKPKAIKKLKLEIDNNAESKTTASRIEIFFPKTIKINTKGFKTCSASKIETQGAGACSSKSKLGTGTARAVVNPQGANPAPVLFRNTFYVGSRTSLSIALKQEGGDINRVLVAKIGKAPGKFGQKLSIDIPADLQQPAPASTRRCRASRPRWAAPPAPAPGSTASSSPSAAAAACTTSDPG